MPLPFSLIEVFNEPSRGFKGNISSVVLLTQELVAEKMQAIARDFNQPATAFLWPGPDAATYHTRWFAPDAEIGLCGHGSLAAISYLGHVQNLSNDITLLYPGGKITGRLEGENSASMLIDPIPVSREEDVPQVLREGLGVPIEAFYLTENKQIVLLKDEQSLKNMKPDFAKLRQSEIFGYSVTAPGDEVDFVSRTLVPHVQQLEDHATGSSHAALAPFWGHRLGKTKMTALQHSPRGGKFVCEILRGSVKLSGHFSVLASGEWQQ